MTREQFNSDIMPYMIGLWPEASAKLTTEQIDLWLIVFNRCRVDTAVGALKHIALTTRWFPKLSDIRKYLSSFEREEKDGAETDQKAIDIAADERRYQRDIEHRDRTMSMLTNEDCEGHRAASMEHDWRLSWMKDMSARGVAWSWIIAGRVARGVGVNDADTRHEVPARPTGAKPMLETMKHNLMRRGDT